MLSLAQIYFIISLVVPMLVPAGMMLTRDSESKIIELAICSATNPRTVLYDLKTGALVNPDPHLASADRLPDGKLGSGHAFTVKSSHYPVSGDGMCPFDLATSDPLLIAVSPDKTAPQTITGIVVAAKFFLSFLSDHPSSPPRGPPFVS